MEEMGHLGTFPDRLVLSAGIVPFKNTSVGRLFLILRAYHHWDFPKGRMERNENPFQAAIRELEEETSLHEVSFPYGYDFYETEPYSLGKIARYYLGEIKKGDVFLPISKELGRPEHHEYRWVDAEEARVLLPQRLQKVLDWVELQMMPEKPLSGSQNAPLSHISFR